MKWLQWTPGRQEGNYDKIKILSSDKFKFDLHILRIPRGSKVSLHKDTVVEGYEHHRANLTLKFASSGGYTLIQSDKKTPYFIKPFRLESSRFYKFRPDLYKHLVTKVTSGSLWILSFGWLVKERNDKQIN